MRMVTTKYILHAENKVEVYNYHLANKLNKLLGTYPEYFFKVSPKEEPVFKFTEAESAKVLKLLKETV